MNSDEHPELTFDDLISAGSSQQVNQTSAELEQPLPSFASFPGSLSINGISVHHYRTIATAANPTHPPISTNHNSVDAIAQNNVQIYPVNHVVSFTVDSTVDSIRPESGAISENVQPDSEDELQDLIRAALADIPDIRGNDSSENVQPDSEDELQDLIRAALADIPDIRGNDSTVTPQVITSDQQRRQTPPQHHNRRRQTRKKNFHMPVSHNYLMQNGAPQSSNFRQIAFNNIVSQGPSTSSSTPYFMHNPPRHVVRTNTAMANINGPDNRENYNNNVQRPLDSSDFITNSRSTPVTPQSWPMIGSHQQRRQPAPPYLNHQQPAASVPMSQIHFMQNGAPQPSDFRGTPYSTLYFVHNPPRPVKPQSADVCQTMKFTPDLFTQNGAPQSSDFRQIAYNTVPASLSASSSTSCLAHSPPCHVVSTSDIGYNQTQPPPMLPESHLLVSTTTPSKNSQTWKKTKVFECNECGKEFHNKSNLGMHLRIHSGIKPFLCEKCSKRFTQKAHLKKHKTIHNAKSVVSDSVQLSSNPRAP